MDSYAKMWFGTEDKMQWIDCPLQGADVSPLGWSAEGTFLNGGGYAKHSWASHRNYVFEWRQSSARRMAQIMHNYRDGVYGRGLIHFVDPLTYDFNILPKQWAYPALMAGEANNPFLRGTALSTVATPANTFNLPIRGAVVPLGSLSGFRAADSVFIPRPENKVLQLWGLYTTSGNATAGVYAIPVLDNGTNGTPVRITPTALNGGTLAEYNLGTGKGVRLCVMKTSAESGTVNLFGLVGRLANADGFRTYSWAGTPDNSASIMRDADGTEIARNHALNPSFEAAGAAVEVARNWFRDPLFVSYTMMQGPGVSLISHGGGEAIVESSLATGMSNYLIPPGSYAPATVGQGVWASYLVEVLSDEPVDMRIANYGGVGDSYRYGPTITAQPGVPTLIHMDEPVVMEEGWTAMQPRIHSTQYPGLRVRVSEPVISTVKTDWFNPNNSPDPDLTPSWTGPENASASMLTGTLALAATAGAGRVAYQSGQWSDDREKSLCVMNQGGVEAGGANVFNLVPYVGKWVYARATARVTDSVPYPFNEARLRSVSFQGGPAQIYGNPAPNTPGEYPLSVTGQITNQTTIRLGAADLQTAGATIWWDNLVILTADTEAELQAQIAALDAVGGYFDGDTPTTAPGSAPLTEWLGGQGQSGARFVGSPTYIENNGVNGGQISYAASFKEVGDWQ